MKKTFFSIASILFVGLFFFASTCFGAAAWGLKVSKVAQSKHYLLWKVICTSNGSALSATDLVALMPTELKSAVQGTTQMVLAVQPGSGAVAPDTTIDVTLTNTAGIPIFIHTGYSASAVTDGISLAEDHGQYPTVYDKFYLTLNDIGTAGDQVTLYFEAWIE